MINVKQVRDGVYSIEYHGYNYTLSIYKCMKRYDNILDEINYRGIQPSKPVALIPSQLVKNSTQFIQGSIHYILYRGEFNVVNQGLLLAMMITGVNQVKDIVDLVNKMFIVDGDYYIVFIGDQEVNLENCTPYNCSQDIFRDAEILLKNIEIILEKL